MRSFMEVIEALALFDEMIAWPEGIPETVEEQVEGHRKYFEFYELDEDDIRRNVEAYVLDTMRQAEEANAPIPEVLMGIFNRGFFVGLEMAAPRIDVVKLPPSEYVDPEKRQN